MSKTKNKFVNYNIYLDISKKIKELVVVALKMNKNDEKVYVILTSIAHHIILDMYKLAKSSLELDLVKKNKINKEVFSFSEITNFLGKRNKKINFNVFGNNEIYAKKKNFFSSFKNSLRFKQAKLELQFSNSNYFLHNESYLLDSLNHKNHSYVFLRPEQWPISLLQTFEVDKILSIIIIQFKKLLDIYNINNLIKKKSLKALKVLVLPKIIYSAAFYNSCESINFQNIKKKRIIGGAPQILGKILNYFFKKNGGLVTRYAHGGDRVFFSDFFWGISELPFCDEYFVHSNAEKVFLEKKLKSKKIFDFNSSKCLIKTSGSPKHQKLLIESKKQKKKKKILFVPGSLLGEAHQALPEFKVPDYLIIDYQIWLMKTFKSFGFEVSVKVHPFGINQSTFLKKFCNKIITNKFDILINSSSVLIFDFAGSAFFDSLTSNKGIVLLNTKVRPFFFEAYKDLKKRCNIVDSFFDKENRIRFVPNDLKLAIEDALNFVSVDNSFSKKYFFK